MPSCGRFVTSASPRLDNHKRRGSIYLLVLGLAMVLTVIGVGAVAVGRAGTRTMNDSADWFEAKSLAFSAVEHALAKITSDTTWRTDFNGQTVTKPLGRGTFSWQLVDEVNGSLTVNPNAAFTVYATGNVNRASYSMHAHMSFTGGGVAAGVVVSGAVTLTGSSLIDSYDSSRGAYGGSNVGSNATVQTNSTAANAVSLAWSTAIRGSVQVGPGGNPDSVVSEASGLNVTGTTSAMSQANSMPTVTAPPNMGVSTGDLSCTGSQVLTLSGSCHVNKLTMGSSGRLRVSGAVTILAENNVSISNSAVIEILPGASLTMCVKGSLSFANSACTQLNGQNLSTVKFMILGTNPVTISGSGNLVQSAIVAPNASVQISNGAQAFGVIIAQQLSVLGNARFHEDTHITSQADPVPLSGSGGSSKPRADSWIRAVR